MLEQEIELTACWTYFSRTLLDKTNQSVPRTDQTPKPPLTGNICLDAVNFSDLCTLKYPSGLLGAFHGTSWKVCRLSVAPNHTLSRNNTLMLQTGTPSLSDLWKALAKISQLINVLFFSPSFWFHFSWIRDITTTLTSKVSQGNIPIFTTEQNESPTKITISLCTR